MIQKSSESVVDHNYNDAQVCAFDYFLNGIPFEYVPAFTLKSIVLLFMEISSIISIRP